MSNLNEIKSLNSLIKHIISNFELKDFIPGEINTTDLCDKFNHQFSKHTDFWAPSNKPKDFPENWCLFNIKSPNTNAKTIYICFCVEKNKIEIIRANEIGIFKNIDSFLEDNDPRVDKTEIKYTEIMLDHEKLVNPLHSALEHAIRTAYQ